MTLRGKKYDVVGATCVEDVQKSVEEQAGLAKEQQVNTKATHRSSAAGTDQAIDAPPPLRAGLTDPPAVLTMDFRA